MPEPLPHHYPSDLSWEIDRRGWLSAPPRQGLLGGPPPQFGGMDDAWSPEHLLVAAANLCLMLTFLSMAEKSGLALAGYRSSAEGVLDKAADGVRFVSVSIRVDLKVAEADQEKAEALLQKAEKHCLISNSLKAPVHVTATFQGNPAQNGVRT